MLRGLDAALPQDVGGYSRNKSYQISVLRRRSGRSVGRRQAVARGLYFGADITERDLGPVPKAVPQLEQFSRLLLRHLLDPAECVRHPRDVRRMLQRLHLVVGVHWVGANSHRAVVGGSCK